jgi:hypothetical protein
MKLNYGIEPKLPDVISDHGLKDTPARQRDPDLGHSSPEDWDCVEERIDALFEIQPAAVGNEKFVRLGENAPERIDATSRLGPRETIWIEARMKQPHPGAISSEDLGHFVADGPAVDEDKIGRPRPPHLQIEGHPVFHFLDLPCTLPVNGVMDGPDVGNPQASCQSVSREYGQPVVGHHDLRITKTLPPEDFCALLQVQVERQNRRGLRGRLGRRREINPMDVDAVVHHLLILPSDAVRQHVDPVPLHGKGTGEIAHVAAQTEDLERRVFGGDVEDPHLRRLQGLAEVEKLPC